MNAPAAPTLARWPFFAADLLLLGLAFWIVSRQPHPLGPVPLALVVGCVAFAAFLGVWPFRLEFSAIEKLAESTQLTSAVDEIRKLESVGEQVRSATGQWQTAQEHSTRAIGAAREIGDRMAAEAKAFSEFMQKANDSEKAHLRLESEKLRRAETEWLHTVIRLMDHIYALQQAATRSGQANLIQQLTSFQGACRDVTRRVGLTPLEATAGELFDAAKHQVVEGQPEPASGATIDGTLATGYSFQGQLLRRALVSVQQTPPATTEAETEWDSSAEPSGDELQEGATESANAPIEDASGQASANPQAEAGEPAESLSFRLESESLLADESPNRRDA